MKLLKAYVENYGTISQKDYNFESGFNCFYHENGYGKTTFASFIKAMFYGLDSQIADRFCERSHFYPFNGGRFGGNLTFSFKGEVYKIERFFDKKSATKDEFNFYKGTEKVVSPIDFSLDKYYTSEETFLKTLFLSESDLDAGNEGVLKLSDFIDSFDGSDYEKALQSLEKVKKSYRQQKGSNDKISRAKAQINALKEEIFNLETIDASLGQKYAEREKIKAELEVVNSQIQTQSNKKHEIEKWEYYDALLKSAEQSRQSASEISKKYPYGVFTSQELFTLNQLNASLNSYKQSASDVENTSANDLRLDALELKFKSGVPTEIDVDNLKKDVSLLSQNEKSKQSATVPVAISLISGVFAVLFVVLGLALNDTFVKILLITLGVGALAFSCVGLVLLKTVKLHNKKADEIISRLKTKLDEYFERYGLNYGDYYNRISQLESLILQYCQYLETKGNNRSASQAIQAKLDEENKKIETLFSKYKILREQDLDLQLKNIYNDVAKINELTARASDTLQKAKEYKAVNRLGVRPDFSTGEFELLNGKKVELSTELTRIDREISLDEIQTELLPEKRTSLYEAEQQLSIYNQKYKELSHAIDFLMSAEKKIRDRYVEPIRLKFVYYAERIESVLGQKVTIDKNFNVFFERSGENRSDKYLSAGQRAISNLCLRLTLTDCIYTEFTPFIILDDPFIALDEKHVEKALNLIKELAKSRQILYFTCHSSRV